MIKNRSCPSLLAIGLALVCLGSGNQVNVADASPGEDVLKSQRESDTDPGMATSVLPFERPGVRVVEYAEHMQALAAGFDDAVNSYVVRVPSAGPGSATRLGPLSGFGAPVRVVRSRWTKSTVDAALKGLAGRTWHPDARRYVYGFFFDPVADVITVSTDAPRSTLHTVLSRFPGLISYNYRTGGGRKSRIADTAPFWGGARIVNVNALRECTSGFTVQNSSGGRLLVSAGHCGSVTHTMDNGNRTQIIGQVRGKAPFPQRDILLIGGTSYGAYIYVGGSTGTGIHVDGAGNPGVGPGYCTSGSFTYERCGLTVRTLSGSLCDQFGCTRNLIGFTGSVLHDGDSGSPFYAYTTNRTHVHIRGMYIGDDATYQYAEKWSSVSGLGYSIAK